MIIATHIEVMRAISSQQTASWKEIRSCVMAVSQAPLFGADWAAG
jgi:hypothetical protein